MTTNQVYIRVVTLLYRNGSEDVYLDLGKKF